MLRLPFSFGGSRRFGALVFVAVALCGPALGACKKETTHPPAPRRDGGGPRDAGERDAYVSDATTPRFDAGFVRDAGRRVDAARVDSGPLPDGGTASFVGSWARRFGGVHDEHARAVAVDVDGNVYVAGSFSDSIDFGGGYTFVDSGSGDAFLASFTSEGTVRWAKTFGGGLADEALAVVATSEAIVVAGHYAGSVDFGTGPLMSRSSTSDVFVAAYNHDGVPRWVQNFGGPASVALATGLAADVDGNAYVIGTFDDSADFDVTTLSASGMQDVFVVRLSTLGMVRWAEAFGGAGVDRGTALATNGGRLFAAASFDGRATFAGASLSSAGEADGVVFALRTSDGGNVWASKIGGSGDDVAAALAVDGRGNVHVGGHFTATATFGGDEPSLASTGAADGFVGVYDPDGNVLGAFRTGGDGDDAVRGLATPPTEFSYEVGALQRSVSFAGRTLPGPDRDTPFIAKRGNRAADDGAETTFERYAEATGTARAVAVLPSGDLILVGDFDGTISAGGETLIGSGGTDVFVVRLSP